MQAPLAIGGYVLAGGQSMRMGQDKARLMLDGRPLVEHATSKLRRICAEVRVLSANAELAAYAPTVRDLHPGFGPLSGMEAALANSGFEWNLVLPVDVPFLPTTLLWCWASETLVRGRDAGTRIAMFQVDGVRQPALLMIHRDVLRYLTAALESGRYKLGPVLAQAAEDLATQRGLRAEAVLWVFNPESVPEAPDGQRLTEAECRERAWWFANLNTPQEFAEAERRLSAPGG